jgi:hypothetical protein
VAGIGGQAMTAAIAAAMKREAGLARMVLIGLCEFSAALITP